MIDEDIKYARKVTVGDFELYVYSSKASLEIYPLSIFFSLDLSFSPSLFSLALFSLFLSRSVQHV